MKIPLLSFLIAILLILASCSSPNGETPDITAVQYRETSGAVPSDSAWEEIYTVSSIGLTFERNGYSPTTTVNCGMWIVNSYGANEASLSSGLAGADVYSVRKTGQDVPPVGGGIKQYTIQYDNGATREVIVGDGTTYNNAGLITTPIDNYIKNVVLPAGAVSRFL